VSVTLAAMDVATIEARKSLETEASLKPEASMIPAQSSGGISRYVRKRNVEVDGEPRNGIRKKVHHT
jgi:hypothetical protein